MDDIYYLVHTTSNPNYKNWTNIKVSNFNTDDQFPGAYFSIITKDNIDKEMIYPNKYILLFSKKLLLQNNYHINYEDHNGIVSENNTYYSWNLDSFIKKVQENKNNNKKTMNEVVFHDNVSMKYLCLTLEKQPGIKINAILPREILENDEEPDLSKKPFYCYPFENIYTGPALPISSDKWYKMIANVCDISIDNNDNNLLIEDKIKKKAYDLYVNRDKQNIELLKEYTISNTGGKNKTNRKNNKKKTNKKKTNKKKINKKKTRKNIKIIN